MNFAQYIEEAGGAYGRDRIAVESPYGTWSYGRLIDEAERFARALAVSGVGRGDRVVALMENRPEYYVAYLAAARLGAILSTVNIDYAPAEISYIVGHCQPTCIAADEAGARKYAEGVADWANAGATIVRIEGRLPDAGAPLGRSYIDIAADAPAAPMVDVPPDEGLLLCYTSGSTNRPKPVLSTHGGERWAARSFRSMWRMTCHDTVLVALPLAWVYGLGTVSFPAFSGGAKVVLVPRFRPDDVCNAIEKHQVTVFPGVTTMYGMLVGYALSQNPRPDFRSIRLALSGGERRNEVAFAKFEELSGQPVFDVYASSEARPVFSYDPLRDRRPLPGASGVLHPGIEAELRDEKGRVVPAGEIGELWIRSPSVLKEYFREPALTADRKDAKGWVRMGDLFRVDANGYWFIEGRTSDMIIRGGANVSPAELEDHLMIHPRIREAIVLGRPDPKYGEEVVAFVVGDFADDDAKGIVTEHCRGAIADYKIPTCIKAMTKLPLGPTGKVDRRALKELARNVT
jgi:acyl-CoA synthetase (AMP-forming)/AMP-acid ligase II